MPTNPLRNACNAAEQIQIRLEMSLAEGQHLQQTLAHILSSSAMPAAQRPPLQRLLAHLRQAADQALRQAQCPVCQSWFAQGATGRRAQYCSAACKQKAYRQRQTARKRHTSPQRD